MYSAMAIWAERHEIARRVIRARFFQERKRFEMVNLDYAACLAVSLARIDATAGAGFTVQPDAQEPIARVPFAASDR